MISILSRIFIKNHTETSDPGVRRAYGVLCGAVGIFLNVLLFAAKYLAGTLTGSIAIVADAFNNLSDAGSSIITLLGFKLAAKKPDRDHPYGHGRFECIAGLVVSFVILMMGFDLAKSSVSKIFHPEAVDFSILSICILTGSILVKLYMALYNRAVGKRISSAAVLATATDSLSDVCATTMVLAATLIARFTGVNIDGWAGAIVSLVILWAGYNAAKDTIDPLLGQAPDPEFVQRIADIVNRYPEVVGIHDLAVHDYGAGRVMISLHAEVPSSGDIMALHDVIDTIERDLQEELNCSAVIHMDPICTDDQPITSTRELLKDRIHEAISPDVSIHDFRMVPGPTHTNVIFDAVVPYEFPQSDEQVREEISRLVRALEGDYFAVVTIDHPVA